MFGLFGQKRKPTSGYDWAMQEFANGRSVDDIYVQADSAWDYNEFDREAHRACVELVQRGAETNMRFEITGEMG